MSQKLKTAIMWLIIIAAAVVVLKTLSQKNTRSADVDFSFFLKKVDEHAIKSVKIKGLSFTGEANDGTEFKTTGIIGENILDRLVRNGVSVRFDKDEDASFWQGVLLTYLPIMLVVFLFFMFMKQIQAGGGKAIAFGKSKAKMLTEHLKKITFKDVAGIDEARDELEEIIAFLKDPKKFQKLGGRIPKGVLLMGPPGTGKTLLARAIAGEAGVPFFSISGSDFVEMFVGVGASRVRDLFEQGKKSAPCIIFIDEIDAVGRHRGAGIGGGHDEREQTLNQLLVEMDGFEPNSNVIIVAATNRPDVLDPALLRPGRFDRRVVIPRPDLRGREGILKVHTRKVPLSENVDLSVIARGTPGFAGADIENLVNEAALHAAKEERPAVTMEDFELAKDKVLMGTERKSMLISDKEKKTTAVHEAGHALVATLLPGTDPVHKVTIIPRGLSLGLTQQLPTEDKYILSKESAMNNIAILMAGRIAEEIIFGEQTTGAGNDIERATEIGRKMVCEWGMSEKLGPLAFGSHNEYVFLGKEISESKDYSERTAQEIDDEVRRIIMESYSRSRVMLLENTGKLKIVADALLEYESLDGEDIQQILLGEWTPPQKYGTRPAGESKAAEAASGNLASGVEKIPQPA